MAKQDTKTNDIELLISNYYDWLKSKTITKSINEFIEISTPFLDNNNDNISIYVKQNGNDYLLNDGGETLDNLELIGVNFVYQKRKKMLEYVLSSFGVTNVNGVLSIHANVSNFSQKKHFLLQAILQINDFFLLSRENVKSIFLEDVENYLISLDVRYTPQITVVGNSGFSHNYEFIISRSKKYPDRFCKVVNNPTKENTSSILFAWNDTKDSRKSDGSMIVFLNDSNSLKNEILEAYTSYDAKVITWSEREKSIELLTA